MTPVLVTIYNIVGFLTGVAAIFVAALFIVVTFNRKSSLAWVNILFTLVSLAIACESFSNAFAGQGAASISGACAGLLVCAAMLTCAVLSIPLYRRVRRHPKYDELQAANRELEYTKRLFKTFLDETPFAAYVVDPRDYFLYVNERTAKELNTTPEQMIGTTYSQWFSPEVSAQFVLQNNEVRSSGKRREFVNDRILTAGKATFLSHVFCLPGLNNESLLGVVSLEISEELKSKATDSLLASIVELSPDAIYTVSDEHRLTSWNKAAERIFGYSAGQIIGQSATILAPIDRVHKVGEVISRLANGEILKDTECVHLVHGGGRKHLSLSATKIKSFLGVKESYAAIARDETETRRAQSEMVDLNRALDARVTALSQANKELPEARDQALEALELRSAFVTNMSHAIRTPLSGILGVSHLLLDKALDSSTAGTVQTVLESAEALLTIVNDILDLSKLEDESQQLESKPFNPATLVNDCVKLVHPGATSKRLKLTTTIDASLPEKVFGDQARIRQILLNLVGNAIKFTATGEVALEVSLISEDVSVATLKFSVADTGIGISSQDAQLLFTPFSRIEKSAKGVQGSGLGLAISKRYVELMHGSIDFESQKTGGSKFWFSLTLKKFDERSDLLANSRSDGKRSNELDLLSLSRILVVEDNPVISTVTIRLLAKFGIKAESAATGRRAIEKIRDTNFDIILMDVNLPDMSGYDVTAAARQAEAEQQRGRAVIIAVTAGAMSGDRDRAIEAGMDDYLAKPVTPEQLRRTLIRWLEMVEIKRAEARHK